MRVPDLSFNPVTLIFSCRYDPINFVDKWSTPMLVIHGSKDYRLPETDGIGAFHALQQYVLHVLRRT